MRRVQIAKPITTAFAARIRVFDFPCTSASRVRVIPEAQLSTANVAVAVSSFKYLLQKLTFISHDNPPNLPHHVSYHSSSSASVVGGGGEAESFLTPPSCCFWARC